jgi:hypothetical protein
MNFNFNQTPSSPLQTPGQLFAQTPSPLIQPQSPGHLPSVQALVQTQTRVQQSPTTASPAIKPDQSRFSSVSRLVGYLPALSLPGLMSLPSLPSLQSLNPMPAMRRLNTQVLNGLERGWQSLKDTFTFQFEEKGSLGTSKEAQANCGPASATMILKQFGIQSPTMQKLRQTVGAPIGTSGGAFALTTQQVAESVKKTASQKGRHISYEIKGLSTNVDTVLNDMRNRLAKGEKLILLTSNLNSLSRGHYIVINEVRPDGSIVVDDPGRASGENAVHTKAQLAKALNMRVRNYGLDNSLISFKA